MTSETFYTVKEAAQTLGLAEATIRRAISRGVLPAKKKGVSRNLIDVDDIERYRQERLGTQGWDKRRDPNYEPSETALRVRNYRARKKETAQQH